MLVTTEGIVLKQRKISNNRRMIVIFTKSYGKISAGTNVNERSKGKSALALRPFTYAGYDIFKNRGYYNINGVDVKQSFYSIGEDIDRFIASSRMMEYLDQILEEEQPKVKLFDMTLAFLEAVSEAESGFATMLYAYIIKSLGMLGVMPELRHCVNCGKTLEELRNSGNDGKMVFSVSDGGIMCGDCLAEEKSGEHTLIFSPEFDIVKTIQYFVDNPIAQFGRVVLKPEYTTEIRHILSEYIKYYLNIDVLDEELQL